MWCTWELAQELLLFYWIPHFWRKIIFCCWDKNLGPLSCICIWIGALDCSAIQPTPEHAGPRLEFFFFKKHNFLIQSDADTKLKDVLGKFKLWKITLIFKLKPERRKAIDQNIGKEEWFCRTFKLGNIQRDVLCEDRSR